MNRLCGARRAELLTAGKTPECWQTIEPPSDDQSAEVQERLAAIAHEKKETLRTLLGVDPVTEQRKREEGVTYPGNRQGNLPPEKPDRTSLIREEFNEHWQQAQAAARQPGASGYEVSATLRQLGTFQPTATEFTRLSELQSGFDREYGHYFNGRTDETALLHREPARQDLDAQIRLALGDPRFADDTRARAGSS